LTPVISRTGDTARQAIFSYYTNNGLTAIILFSRWIYGVKIGIDIGSTTVKTVVLEDTGKWFSGRTAALFQGA
jgi:activator of 2-hydroxyglutaryl-CoA dehydratase